MAQYWDSRFKIEKIKNSKRVTCVIQTTLRSWLWKSQMGRRRKSVPKAQRHNKKLHVHRASKVESFPLCECCARFGFSAEGGDKFVTLHWKRVVPHGRYALALLLA